MNRRDELNEALTAALQRGERPFRCWACREWFTETGVGRGRPRTICGSDACFKARQHYQAIGCAPPCPGHAGNRENSTLTRAIVRALEADWLNDREISEELGCSSQQVSVIRTRLQQNKFKRAPPPSLKSKPQEAA